MRPVCAVLTELMPTDWIATVMMDDVSHQKSKMLARG